MPGKRGPAVTLDLNQIRKDAAKRRADRKEAERKSKELDKGAVERGNREQKREAESLKEMRKRNPRGMAKGGMAKSGKFPDLNKDGKVTKADVLMGRGVVKKRKGGKVMSGCGGKVKKMAYGGKVKKMAKGGKVNHKGCGIAKRGLTKGRMV
jgi:hypothetical protein